MRAQAGVRARAEDVEDARDATRVHGGGVRAWIGGGAPGLGVPGAGGGTTIAGEEAEIPAFEQGEEEGEPQQEEGVGGGRRTGLYGVVPGECAQFSQEAFARPWGGERADF